MKDYETARYELLASVDECFKRIQVQSASLKNADDKDKNLAALLKIQDSIADIRKSYSDLEQLDLEAAYAEYEAATAEEEENEYATGSSFLNPFP